MEIRSFPTPKSSNVLVKSTNTVTKESDKAPAIKERTADFLFNRTSRTDSKAKDGMSQKMVNVKLSLGNGLAKPNLVSESLKKSPAGIKYPLTNVPSQETHGRKKEAISKKPKMT